MLSLRHARGQQELRLREVAAMTERAGQGRARPAAGTFRAALEITNRSGHVTREYRLRFLPDRVRIAYAAGRISYDIRFDEERGEVVCTCPAFEGEGCCKHCEAMLALLDGLTQ